MREHPIHAADTPVPAREDSAPFTLEKRHAEQELPSTEVARSHGIEVDLTAARVILCVASRLLVEGYANERTQIERAMRTIALAVSLPIEDLDGDIVPPRLPPPPSGLTPTGKAARKRLGIRSIELNDAFARGHSHAASCLPLECVLEFLPAPAWSYLAAFISCGPQESRVRIAAAADYRGGHMSFKGLDTQLDAVQALMRCLVRLHDDHAESDALRQAAGKTSRKMPELLHPWSALPRKLTPAEVRAKAKGTVKRDTTALPFEAVSEGVKDAAREAGWGRWDPSDWPQFKNWRALKRFVMLVLLAAIGLRREHLANLEIGDFRLEHRFRDGHVASALVLRGECYMKGRRNGYVFAIELPPTIVRILVAWTRCNGWALGESEGPLFPSKKPLPGRIGSPHGDIGGFIAGRAGRANGLGSQRALIRLPGERYLGYQAHRYRSTLKQGVDRLAHSWRLENPGHKLSTYADEVLAECLLDHTRQDLGYLDIRRADGEPTARFEELASHALRLWWSEIWGDGPYLRRGIDPDAIEAAHDRVEILKAEIRLVEADRTRQREDGERLRKRVATTRRGEEAKLLLEMHLLIEEQGDAASRLTKLWRSLAEAEEELRLALSTEVPLPEHVGDEEYGARLDQILAQIRGEAVSNPELDESSPLADELLVRDVAELYAVTTQHVGRWRRGLSNPPLSPAGWIEYGPHDFRFPVGLIDHNAVRRIPHAEPLKRLEEVRRGRAAVSS